ncbi:MAG: SNF2-related protein [Oligoflexus sp.]
MEDLFTEIREQCSREVWSKGVQLARRDTVTGDVSSAEEIHLRVLDRDRGISAKVQLFLDDLDWHSDCQCKIEPCYHVAAAVIALKRAQEQGQELPQSKTASAHVGYRLIRQERSLFFKRVQVSGDGEEDIQGALSTYATGRIGQISATKEDLAIEQALGYERRGVLSSDSMLKILKLLPEVNDVQLDGKPIQIQKEALNLIVTIRDEGPGIHVRGKIDPRIEESFVNGAALSATGLHPSPPLSLARPIRELLQQGQVLGRQELADFVSKILPQLKASLQLDIQSKNLPRLVHHQTMDLELLLEAHGSMLKVVPSITYGSPPLARLTADGFQLLSSEAPSRDPDEERRLKDSLWRDLRLEFDRSQFYHGSDAVDFVRSLQSWPGHISGSGVKRFQSLPALSTQCLIGGATGDSLSFDLQFTSTDPNGDKHAADPHAVLKAWQEGERYVSLMEGSWAPLPQDWLAQYGAQVQALLEAKGEKEELSKVHLPSLAQLADDMQVELPRGLQNLRQQMEDFRGLGKAELPTPFHANLRDYQQSGVNWLSFLKKQGLGALLADDMGLGKTLQAITVLEGPSLVIAPTSVLPNWQKELQRFRPNLKVHLYHGSQRQWDNTSDVVLTSYGLLRQDLELFQSMHWRVLVLDEAQWIKNPDSQVSRAAYALRAEFRICLSGTPVENHLEDIWSLQQFLNPGLLGSRQYFRDAFVKPIQEGVAPAQLHLQQKLKPFLLRRLKKEVAPELPPRIEKVLYAELSPEERQNYDSILAATRKEVVDKLSSGGNVLEVLEVLLRMRQACCHPALLPGGRGDHSAKLEILLEHLQTALEEGHKALIFSQWTSFLDLIGEALDQAGINFLRLDGSTRNRGELVQSFQEESGPPVLIMSLKAGGVGLNLSRADHVFIMDPWWNPAVEDQAADRAHRIGQENTVMIHPIVALHSVEEKILELQQHKRALSEAAVGSGAQALELTRDDLLRLFD